MTHENSTPEENLPYLSYVLRPVPVMTLFGRSADNVPKINRPDAVWYCWKDRYVQHGVGVYLIVMFSH